MVRKKNLCIKTALAGFIVFGFIGCGTTQTSSNTSSVRPSESIRPSETEDVVFKKFLKPIDVTRNAAVNALRSMGFTIIKGYNSGDTYVEGEKRFTINRFEGGMLSAHHGKAKYKIWLESLGEETKVYVGGGDARDDVSYMPPECHDDAKRVLLENNVLFEMEKILSGSQ